jgi:hypothetical protein
MRGLASWLRWSRSPATAFGRLSSRRPIARDLIVQETGWKRLHADGIALIATDTPDQFVDDTPIAVVIRQNSAPPRNSKAMTLAKLRGARDRKRRRTGQKVEDRKSLAEPT